MYLCIIFKWRITNTIITTITSRDPGHAQKLSTSTKTLTRTGATSPSGTTAV